jgi:hypothetical protein
MTDSKNMSAILMATAMSETITHPFEVIKTKKQINYNMAAGNQSSSQLSTIINSVRQRTVRDLYKGFSPAIIKGIQLQTIRFGLYDLGNQFIRKSLLPSDAGAGKVFLSKVVSAFTSSLIAGLTANPWMILKVKMIADKSGEYKTLRQSFKNVTRNDGYQEFLRGTSLSLIRGIILSTVELTVYDTFKGLFKQKEGLDLRASFLGSIAASLSGALVSYPLDILRTIYVCEKREEGKSGLKQMGNLAKNVYQTRGVRGFYQGFMPYLSKSLIYGPLFWNSLELFNHVCKNYLPTFSLGDESH